MKVRRPPDVAVYECEALGYETATPYLTPLEDAPPGCRSCSSVAEHSGGSIIPGVWLGTLLGLGTTSVVLLALMA